MNCGEKTSLTNNFISPISGKNLIDSCACLFCACGQSMQEYALFLTPELRSIFLQGRIYTIFLLPVKDQLASQLPTHPTGC